MSKSNPVKSYLVNGKKFYKLELDCSGYRIRKRGFINKSSALDYLKKVEHLIALDQYDAYLEDQKASNVTVNDCFNLWKRSRGKKIKRATEITYTKCYELKLKEVFGSVLINKVSQVKINKFIFAIREQGYSESYLNACIASLKAILNHGYKTGLLKEKFRVDFRAKKRARVSFLKSDQVFAILEAAKTLEHPYNFIANLIAVQFYCFMRIGEVICLKKEDIDLNKMVLRINKNVYQGVLGTIKNNVSIEDFPIHKELVPFLKSQMLLSGSSEYLFPPVGFYKGVDCSGYKYQWIDKDSVNLFIRRAAERTCVDPKSISSHTFRKSAINFALEQGFPLKEVEYAARINAVTILKHYSIADKEKFQKSYKSKDILKEKKN